MAGFWQNLFGRATVGKVSLGVLQADMHSHLLPGLDDGAETLEQSLELVAEMIKLGYKKLIMTPHIMGDFYKNTPEGIQAKLDILQEAIKKNDWQIELACAAEYYLDEWFVKRIENGERLLTFGDNYLLFETSYLNQPLNLNEVIFTLKSAGYTPVLAHPERYTYFYRQFDALKQLHENGILFQVNLNSLTGYYSQAARHVAEKLIDLGMVNFAGTDTHSLKHIQVLQKVQTMPYLQKLLALPLKNNQL